MNSLQWNCICLMILLIDHSCHGFYDAFPRYIHSLIQDCDPKSNSLYDSKYFIHQLRGGDTREVVLKDKHPVHSPNSYQHRLRRQDISVEEMERRLEALKNRKPSYRHQISERNIPPPPPPPNISLEGHTSPKIEEEENSLGADDEMMKLTSSKSLVPTEKMNQREIYIDPSDQETSTEMSQTNEKVVIDSLTNTIQVPKIDSSDPTLFKPKNYSVVKIAESTFSSCKKIATTIKVLSNIGGKTLSYVSGMVLSEKVLTKKSKSIGDMKAFDPNRFIGVVTFGQEKPWELHQNMNLLDMLDSFGLYYKIWSVKVPEPNSPIFSGFEDAAFQESCLDDACDVSEADENDASQFERSETLSSTIKSCLLQSILPMLQEYTEGYMMHMPIRTKRSTRVIIKSFRVRETLLSRIDTSDRSPDITNEDFERLLLELSSGPSEEMIEEIEYEYDEWPQHYEMLEHMKDKMLSVISDENYLIEYRTDDASAEYHSSRHRNSLCDGSDNFDVSESQYDSTDSFCDMSTNDDSDEFAFYGLSEDMCD